MSAPVRAGDSAADCALVVDVIVIVLPETVS